MVTTDGGGGDDCWRRARLRPSERRGGAGDGAGAAGAFGLSTCVPPLSNLTVTPGVGIVGGRTAMETLGMLPPVWKNASRTIDAIWNWRSAAWSSEGSTPLPCRQVHWAFDVSA